MSPFKSRDTYGEALRRVFLEIPCTLLGPPISSHAALFEFGIVFSAPYIRSPGNQRGDDCTEVVKRVPLLAYVRVVTHLCTLCHLSLSFYLYPCVSIKTREAEEKYSS